MTRPCVRVSALLVGLLALATLASGPATAEDDAGAPWRAWVQKEFLQGRLDQPFVDAALWEAEDPVALWPLALRDLWWRPAPDPDRRRHYEGAARSAPEVLQPPYQWLLDGGAEAFPAPPAASDPWPVLTALILDRQRRERRGRAGLPDESPLALMAFPGTSEDAAWWDEWRTYFLDDVMAVAYRDPEIRAYTSDQPDERELLDEQARGRRTLNIVLAGLLSCVLVLGSLWLGRRLGPKPT